MSASPATRLAVLFAVAMLASVCSAAECPKPVCLAVHRLAQFADVPAEEIKIISFEAIDWPDSSLGAPREGRMYTQVIVPGYRVLLEARGQVYEYHTDMDRRVVLAHKPEAQKPVPLPSVDDVVGRCMHDLAERLGVPVTQVSVVKTLPTEFPNSALGLPVAGEAYLQVITPGQWVVLEASAVRHLYAAGRKSFRYGGPLDSWRYSALYTEPDPDDPNMNGTLVQVSLVGTNPVRLLPEVSEAYPQLNGTVIAKRRTSRSSHQLILVDPRALGDGQPLAGAMDFEDAVTSLDGAQWAAIVRPRLGENWRVVRAKVGENLAGGLELPGADLPLGAAVGRLYWTGENPVLESGQYPTASYFELQPDYTWKKLEWFGPPQEELRRLNKSETLEIRQVQIEGKPGVKVSRMWFTGDEKPIATVADFVLFDAQITPERRFAFLSGRNEETRKGLAVDLATGQVLASVTGADAPPWLLLAPPVSRPRLEGLAEAQ